MVLPSPELDDRRQEDLFLEARSLIPRYAPTWTDWNDSDPGIAMLQLVAWMADQAIFRLNQVPDRLYLKLLELVGISLRPAAAARTQLTFGLVDPPASSVLVPRGTRVAADPVDGGVPVVFETELAVEAIGAPLTAVRSFDGTRYDDHTAANDVGTGFPAFGPVVRVDSSLLLGFGVDPPIGDVQLSLFVQVAAPSGEPVSVTCLGEGRRPRPPGDIVWEGWDGHLWSPLSLDVDETRAFTRSGAIRLTVRGSRLAALTLAGDLEPRRWIRARLARSDHQVPPLLAFVATNTVAASAARTVTLEVVGGSTGLPDQQLTLASTPVVPGSLVLEVDEGSGPVRWREVDDFYGEGADAEVFTLDEVAGLVTFGGIEGRPPSANAADPTGNVVAATYRAGGGPEGNLPAGTVNTLQSPVDGIRTVTNRVPADGGRATETVAAARQRAGAEMAARGRAVTTADFEHLARSTPTAPIGRAIALARTSPAFPGVEVPGAVTVLVVPDVDGPAPRPTDATLAEVCAQLDRHRLVTTEVHVVGPRYRPVRVGVDLVVDPSADLGAVRQAVDAALDRWFHPLTGGERASGAEQGTGWPLGGTIYASLVYRTILDAHPGVLRIETPIVVLDGRPSAACVDVELGPTDLLEADGHDVRVRYA